MLPVTYRILERHNERRASLFLSPLHSASFLSSFFILPAPSRRFLCFLTFGDRACPSAAPSFCLCRVWMRVCRPFLCLSCVSTCVSLLPSSIPCCLVSVFFLPNPSHHRDVQGVTPARHRDSLLGTSRVDGADGKPWLRPPLGGTYVFLSLFVSSTGVRENSGQADGRSSDRRTKRCTCTKYTEVFLQFILCHIPCSVLSRPHVCLQLFTLTHIFSVGLFARLSFQDFMILLFQS